MAPDKAANTPQMPALATVLGHAQHSAGLSTSADSWLCRFFGVERQRDWPVAAYTCLADGIDPGDAFWLRADPVHFHLQRDHFVLVDSGMFDLSLEEARQFAGVLNTHFGADGIQFFAPYAKRWYLRLPQDPEITTHAPADAAGQDVHTVMPWGRQAAKWNALLNEAQMLLHEHPANLLREERGELPINSFWLWGGGRLLYHPAPDVVAVWCEDALTRGLSLACGKTLETVPDGCGEWLAHPIAASGTHLVVLDLSEHVSGREALAGLERRWFAPLLQAMKSGQVESAHLIFAEPHRVTAFKVLRDDLWKFWRRPKTLADALSDSED